MYMQFWRHSRREIDYAHGLVMAIMNVTPDSFSDGGRYSMLDDALAQHRE
jgi:dihydropteroate synthase